MTNHSLIVNLSLPSSAIHAQTLQRMRLEHSSLRLVKSSRAVAMLLSVLVMIQKQIKTLAPTIKYYVLRVRRQIMKSESEFKPIVYLIIAGVQALSKMSPNIERKTSPSLGMLI
jgi:hypothetical protein